MRNISYPNGGNQYQRNITLTQQMYNAVVQAISLGTQKNELNERRKELFNPKNPIAAVGAAFPQGSTVGALVIVPALVLPFLLPLILRAQNMIYGFKTICILIVLFYLVTWVPIVIWSLKKAPKILDAVGEYNNSLNHQIGDLEKQRVQHVLVLEKLDLPQRYRNEDALIYIYNLFVNRRAGSFQEAFNIYENEMRANSARRSQERHNAQVRRQLANQSRQANRNAEAIRNEIYWNNRRF